MSLSRNGAPLGRHRVVRKHSWCLSPLRPGRRIVCAFPEIAPAEKTIILSFLDFSVSCEQKQRWKGKLYPRESCVGPFKPASRRTLLTIILHFLSALFWPGSRWSGVWTRLNVWEKLPIIELQTFPLMEAPIPRFLFWTQGLLRDEQILLPV